MGNHWLKAASRDASIEENLETNKVMEDKVTSIIGWWSKSDSLSGVTGPDNQILETSEILERYKQNVFEMHYNPDVKFIKFYAKTGNSIHPINYVKTTNETLWKFYMNDLIKREEKAHSILSDSVICNSDKLEIKFTTGDHKWPTIG